MSSTSYSAATGAPVARNADASAWHLALQLVPAEASCSQACARRFLRRRSPLARRGRAVTTQLVTATHSVPATTSRPAIAAAASIRSPFRGTRGGDPTRTSDDLYGNEVTARGRRHTNSMPPARSTSCTRRRPSCLAWARPKADQSNLPTSYPITRLPVRYDCRPEERHRCDIRRGCCMSCSSAFAASRQQPKTFKTRLAPVPIDVVDAGDHRRIRIGLGGADRHQAGHHRHV